MSARSNSNDISALSPAIPAALEAASVEFTNGDQPGVRLRKPQRA